jgi:hypothetical protein
MNFEQTTLIIENFCGQYPISLNVSTKNSKTNHYFIDIDIYTSDKRHFQWRVLKTEYDGKFLKNFECKYLTDRIIITNGVMNGKCFYEVDEDNLKILEDEIKILKKNYDDNINELNIEMNNIKFLYPADPMCDL